MSGRPTAKQVVRWAREVDIVGGRIGRHFARSEPRRRAVGFEVIPRRWVVERTFGWLTRWRRLNRNYEHTLASSKAVVQVALIGIMTRRLAKTNKA